MAGTRHYCTTCNQRVYPYDSMELLTEAPGEGVSGGSILLFSANARRRARGEPLQAWCHNCGGWVTTELKDRVAIMADYFRRKGVRVRLPNGHRNGQVSLRAYRAEIERRLEQRREAL